MSEALSIVLPGIGVLIGFCTWVVLSIFGLRTDVELLKQNAAAQTRLVERIERELDDLEDDC